MSETGTCKSFNARTGFGFIIGSEGEDVYVHARDCVDSMVPQPGDIVNYDVEDSDRSPGTKVARKVTGGSAKQTAEGAAIILNGTGAFEGVVKSFSPIKAFGFIIHEGEDLFFHGKECKGSNPAEGDTVRYDVVDSTFKEGMKTAVNVTGGSLPITSHKDAKGKDKGKPGKWGYGDDGWTGPYGMDGMHPGEMMAMQMMGNMMMKGMKANMMMWKGKMKGKMKAKGKGKGADAAAADSAGAIEDA
eukprot:TRINITY_DN3092_c0_g1_i1.p1 TRINITY_DN3092_c0_g1~~TRINITY_DN3092_c0_g1_i1.p1  ORF type:complete len:245 (-),score=77.50 TRINITY_DN3092_c0_g1_i1:323-1057(-)